MRFTPPLPAVALLLALCGLAPPAPAQPDHYTLTLPAGPQAPQDIGSGSIELIGNATVLIRYQGFCILTDPNFLHAGERAHLGYGATTTRLAEPALALEALPPIDLVLLSHLHEDHFDRGVQQKLRRDVPIVTTREAAERLGQLGFTQRYPLGRWDSLTLRKGPARLRITAMPARHGPRGVALLLPPVNGAMLDFEQGPGGAAWRIYISGDTVLFDDIAQIPQRFPDIDLALLHLGGEQVLGMQLSMDGADGVRMMQVIAPARVIPIHTDDYSIFRSRLPDFERAVQDAGLQDKVIWLRPGQRYGFAPAAR